MVDQFVRTTASPPRSSQSDPDRMARAITGRSDLAVIDAPPELRQGVITAVDVAAARVDVALGGDTTSIPGVAHLSNYRPTVNDPVWVLVNGPDLLVLDRLGAFGPSVISSVQSAVVATRQLRSATTYGDLTTVGPTVTASVSPSGRLVVQTSVFLYQDNAAGATNGGGAMAFQLSGANTRGPFDLEANVLFHAVSGVLSPECRTSVTASRVTLLTGLTAGNTTVTCKYRSVSSSGFDGTFEDRTLWVLPL